LYQSIFLKILYGTSNGSEDIAFTLLKSKKDTNAYSLINENLLDKWAINLNHEFSREDCLAFFNMINNYKLICAEKRVFDLNNKWKSYCSIVNRLELNMETKIFDFIESVLKGALIENMLFDLSCNDPDHENFTVSYRHLNRAVCPLCSRIERSHSYQDFVNEAESRNASLGFTEAEFRARINKEFKKPREEQQTVSEILFPFICNKHGEFDITMERITDYNNWCPECYYESRRLKGEQIIARGNKYKFNLETSLDYIYSLTRPSREDLEWSCKFHPSFRFRSKPDDYSLDLKSCDICSGGTITNERIMRYLLFRLFNKNFGESPTPLYKILPFEKIVSLLPSDYSTIISYNRMHFDAFAYVDIYIDRNLFTLSVIGEYWDREHTSLEEYIDRFRHRTPRNGNFNNDYQHLKSSDNFKQTLKTEGLIDIYIVVEHTI